MGDVRCLSQPRSPSPCCSGPASPRAARSFRGTPAWMGGSATSWRGSMSPRCCRWSPRTPGPGGGRTSPTTCTTSASWSSSSARRDPSTVSGTCGARGCMGKGNWLSGDSWAKGRGHGHMQNLALGKRSREFLTRSSPWVMLNLLLPLGKRAGGCSPGGQGGVGTLPASHMHPICISHASHMHPICIPHVSHLPPAYTPRAPHLHPPCTPPAPCLQPPFHPACTPLHPTASMGRCQ